MGSGGIAIIAVNRVGDFLTMNVGHFLTVVRGLNGDLLDMMGVAEVTHTVLGNQVISFPYQNENGEVYACKFRTIDKRFMATPGVSRDFYNLPALYHLADQPIVITEGEIDTLSTMQVGWDRSVSVPDGWSSNANRHELFLRHEDALRNSPFVVVASDADESGESLPWAVSNALRGHPVKWVRWPAGTKDANDMLVQHGHAALHDALHAAKLVDPPGGQITGLSDLPPQSERRILRTGDPAFDRRVALEVGEISVGTGAPGSGKTTFITSVVHKMAGHEKIRIGLCLFETPATKTRDTLFRLQTGRPYDQTTGEDRAYLLRKMDADFRLVHRIYDEEIEHGMAWLEEVIYALAVRDGCRVVILDPWNELSHFPAKGESLTQYINFALSRTRALAARLEIHICILAHPQKMPRNADGTVRSPTGYDISDSAAFYNKSSLGFTVHRTYRGERELTLLTTWKSRDVQTYQVDKGATHFSFDTFSSAYLEVSKEELEADDNGPPSSD